MSTATADEIRDAYVRQARRHHPDGGSAASSDAMAAVNESYRVLRDPGRRAMYDASLAAPRSGSAVPPARSPRPAPAAPVIHRDEPGPARYPWKLVAVLAVLGVGVVLLGAALARPASTEPPDNLLEPGSCVTIEANGDAREVTCGDAADDLVVRQFVTFDEVCPPDLDAHRDHQGRGYACVAERGAEG